MQPPFINRISLAIAGILLCASSAIARDEPIKLEWKLKPGQRYQVTLNQKSESLTQVDARESLVNSDHTVVMNWLVKSAKPNKYVIEQSLAAVKLSVGNPAITDQVVSYDTRLEKQDISRTSKKLLKQIRPLIGLKFLVTMAATGEVKSVDLPASTQDAIQQLPETQQLRKLFSKDGLQEMMGATILALPAEAIPAGHQWNSSKIFTTALGKFERKRNFQFARRRVVDGKTFAEVDIQLELTTLEPTVPTDPTDQPGKLVSFEGQGKTICDFELGFFPESMLTTKTVTQRKYREKTIQSTVNTEVKMNFQRLDNAATETAAAKKTDTANQAETKPHDGSPQTKPTTTKPTTTKPTTTKPTQFKSPVPAAATH